MKIKINDKISHFFKDRRILYIAAAVLGLILIFASSFNSAEDISASSTYDNSYGEYLEGRLSASLESILGKGNVDVFITFENTYEVLTDTNDDSFSIFSSSTKANNYTEKPLPKIAGVMIVCKNIESTNDFKQIKKAAAVALNTNEKKINIIGGKHQ